MKRKLIIGLITLLSFVFFSFNYNNILGIPVKYFGKEKTVHATIYKPYKKNNTTASGYKFTHHLSDTIRIIAVSRDLSKEYPFGTKVLVIGTGSLDDIYTVRDLMNKRIKNTIDILVPSKHKLCKFNKVRIIKINDIYFNSNII